MRHVPCGLTWFKLLRTERRANHFILLSIHATLKEENDRCRFDDSYWHCASYFRLVFVPLKQEYGHETC